MGRAELNTRYLRLRRVLFEDVLVRGTSIQGEQNALTPVQGNHCSAHELIVQTRERKLQGSRLRTVVGEFQQYFVWFGARRHFDGVFTG
jgi:hypothetical protein